ncbi:MAG: polysaccharide biosynthesis C-terminal domain-containing protein [Saprospiraceae bacterium]|jgi:O-antigen/teichoic acid export membrane protein|nr:polysaccharide biosynthesis C-terminal domain-containing protein [Saprospiraceae bacterium]
MKPWQSVLKLDSVKAFQLAGILRQLASLLTGIILAHSGFSVKEIGSYEYVLFFVTTASFFWVNGILQYFMARSNQSNEPHPERTVTQLLILLALVSVVVLNFLHFSAIAPLNIRVLWLVSLLLMFNVPSLFIEQILYRQNSIVVQVSLSVGFLAIQIIFLLSMLFFKLPFENVYNILLILALCKFIFLVTFTKAYIFNKGLFQKLLKIFKTALPFIGYFIITGMASIVDGWIIKFRWHDEGMFAIYKYGARDLPLLGSLAIGLGSAILPMITSNLEYALQQIKTRSTKLMHVVYPIMIVMVAFSDKIFPFLLNSDFKETSLIFSVYAFIIGARFLYPQTILSGLGYNRFLFYNSIIELTINIMLSLVFSLYFGLAGIALGSVMAYFYEKISASLYLFKKQGIRLHEYTPLPIYLFYNSLLAVIFVISHLN